MMAIRVTKSEFDNLGTHIYNNIENYIFLHHVYNKDNTKGVLLLMPQFSSDSITDTSSVHWNSTTPLARSAPIFSYSDSGPRALRFAFKLHRDMMSQINYGTSNMAVGVDDDYVDLLIKYLQAAALPNYNATNKLVDPPLITVKMSDDIYIKGIVSSSVGITYNTPIIWDKTKTKSIYSNVDIGFDVTEVTPYDATTIMDIGSYRISGDLSSNVWTPSNSMSEKAATALKMQNSYFARGGIGAKGTPGG